MKTSTDTTPKKNSLVPLNAKVPPGLLQKFIKKLAQDDRSKSWGVRRAIELFVASK